MSGLDHPVKRHVWRRIKIKCEPAGPVGVSRLAVPGVQLESCRLCDGREAFEAIDLEIRLAVPGYGRHFQQIGNASRGVSLEEMAPAIPSGARTIEHGLPFRWTIIHGPTVS
jgi:hypothetical protein